MEIEQSTQVMSKKLWNIVRIVFFMLRKSISKSKIAFDFHLMLKRGKHAGKAALSSLIFHHHNSAFSSRSNDFIAPKEYEFSCSNSPANFYPFQANKRRLQHNSHHLAKAYKYDDVTTLSAVQRVLEMLNNEAIEAPSPMVLPGFGRSPMVRQLRVTDSPFPSKDEGDSQVDKAAEEFIKKFYKDLKLQKSLAIESPYHDTWGR